MHPAVILLHTKFDLILKNHYNIIMNTIKFDWDNTKAKSNLAKKRSQFLMMIWQD